MDSTIATVVYDMGWVFEPTAWLGMLALCLIQIVLGIDNLVFIAVLSARLPPRQRDKARYIGIGGALIIRLILLMFAAYIMAISKPLFTLFDFEISVRDLVMFLGGLFLLYKSTQELHEKLEGPKTEAEVALSNAAGKSLLLVSVQIMILDALFSVDAIVTAVGMTSNVYIMMIAVTIAMGVMTWASGFVTEFVIRHPTLVILCLGFLLLIGFSLMMEALHIEVPKGYLYAAIGFSIMIEVLNSIARKNTLQLGSTKSMQNREIAANLVLRLLGSKHAEVASLRESIVQNATENVFNTQEQEMVGRVLTLSSLPVKAVMTTRSDLEMLRIDEDIEAMIKKASQLSHSYVIAYRGTQKDQPQGIIKKADLLALYFDEKPHKNVEHILQEPVFLPESINILKALEEFRKQKRYIGCVYDEFGNFEGMVTLHDLVEEIAGELPDQSESPKIVRVDRGQWHIEGEVILTDVLRVTGFKVPLSDHYQTIAGFILDYLQRLPEQGEKIALGDWQIDIVQSDSTSIELISLTNLKLKALTHSKSV